MSPLMVGVIGMIVFVVFMLFGMSIPLSMLIVGIVGFAVIRTPDAAVQLVGGELFNQFSSYMLTVGPLFGLMGYMANVSGIGKQLFKCANSFIGHWRGGMAMATMTACTGFGAICGSVPATIATMSSIAYPEMKSLDYKAQLSGTTIAVGATLAVLIPPSTPLVIYGIATETSIGALFMGGIMPGLLLLGIYFLTILFMIWRHPDWAGKSIKDTWRARWLSVKNGGLIEIGIIFIIAIGGLFGGLFTATEAGAVGAFGLTFICILERRMTWKAFKSALWSAVSLEGMVFFLLACATVFGRFFAASGIPALLGSFVKSIHVGNWVILCAIFLVFFILGMLTDLLSMSLVLMPIFFPIVTETLGYNPIWFGIVIVLFSGIGGLTPPVGIGIFITKGCIRDDSVSLGTLFSGIWPFVFSTFACVVILSIFPGIVTWLPNLILYS